MNNSNIFKPTLPTDKKKSDYFYLIKKNTFEELHLQSVSLRLEFAHIQLEIFTLSN